MSEFVYFGISVFLEKSIDEKYHTDNIINLQFNVDGFSPFKSSLRQFWPILGRVYTDPCVYKPFTVATYSGLHKPFSVYHYFEKFINELNLLLCNGIIINGKKFLVRLMCFPCDKPARVFIKLTKGHTGFSSCERCCDKGYRKNNRTLFSEFSAEKRTDLSFRNKLDPAHHIRNSPLLLIEPKIDMINDFTLDFMHAGFLGCTKKILEYLTINNKLDKNSILRITTRLMNLSSQLPSEFQRGTRSLGELSKWKAVEFRFFLLYCGIVVLKDIVSAELWEHFVLFSIGSRILCSNDLCSKYINEAEKYMEKFVELAGEIYNENINVSNIHTMLHVSDDPRNKNKLLR